MEAARYWKSLFQRWPRDLPKRGLLVTTLNEQLPFKSFMIEKDFVVLERTNPDPQGSRYLFVPYESISIAKIVDVIPEKVFASMGFEGKLTGK